MTPIELKNEALYKAIDALLYGMDNGWVNYLDPESGEYIPVSRLVTLLRKAVHKR